MKRKSFIKWQVTLLNMAISHSSLPWSSIINAMILKDPNNTKIHHLQVIHLYEHDYNLLPVVKWHLFILHCSSHYFLNPGQFGSIPSCNAIQATIIKELHYEITWASQCPFVHLDCDATTCYDCIILSLSGIRSHSYDQHQSFVFINTCTLLEGNMSS